MARHNAQFLESPVDGSILINRRQAISSSAIPRATDMPIKYDTMTPCVRSKLTYLSVSGEHRMSFGLYLDDINESRFDMY